MILPPYQPTSWQRGIQKLAALPSISSVLARTLYRIDPLLLNSSGGKYTATTLMTGLPVIWLTTIGARSNSPRTTPLVAIPDGLRLVLVASYFGKDRHPGWFYNIKANPRVIIKWNSTEANCLAQEVEAAEYDRLWQIAVSTYPGYASYKQRAGERRIPLIALSSLEHTN